MENRYRLPKGLAHSLNPNHFVPTTLPSTNDEQASGELYSLWRTIPEGHKWHHYFRTYTEALDRLGNTPIRMLEIGVYKGSSAKMWNQFLPAGSIFVGIDIEPECSKYENISDNLFIRIGDQSDPEFLAGIVDEFGRFDFILDDGSHRCSHMIASFNYLFLTGLNSPGVYLVEDTHTNFWEEFRDQNYSFIDLAKDLVDFMHFHYINIPHEIFFRKDHKRRVGSASVPRIAAEIDEIQFRDSLVVIQKRTKTALPISEHL